MREIRLILRCDKDKDHAKVLRIDKALGMGYADTLAGLLDGTSPLYVYPPGDQSPIGKCAVCGGKVKSEVNEVEVKPDAKRPSTSVHETRDA